jgi:hypothetical protein
MQDPIVIVAVIVLAGLLVAVPLLVAALRRLRRFHLLRGTLYLSIGSAAVLATMGVVLVALNLFTYARLTHEQQAARVAMRQLAERQYAVTVQPSAGAPQQFELRGDEWQIDARVLKWRAFGTLLGFDTVYRLERLSGRYTDIAQERSAQRTVHALTDEPGIDLWSIVRRHHRYLPLADALYGSAVYVPMADGAEYAVSVSASGLVVRPGNEAARKALGGWK